MAKTNTASQFERLIAKLQPSDKIHEAASRHIAVIRTRLRKDFDLKSLFVVGSVSRDTFIRGLSDVDAFAVVSRKDARWGGKYVDSSTALEGIRQALRFRFPQTNVHKDGEAIVVPFGDMNIDVVPAF